MVSNKPKHLIAVYGTLRKGQHNHHLLDGCDMVTAMRVDGYKMHTAGGFPVVYHAPFGSTIEVEVYHVSDRVLKELDLLEGHPNWYRRYKMGEADVGDGTQDIEIYIMLDDDYRNNQQIEHGDWVKFKLEG